MTVKEAVETIKTAIAEVEWEYPMDYDVAFDMAIEALEKQIPKQLVERNGWIYCKCGAEVFMQTLSDGRRFEYCPICGQKIDWSDEE